MNPTRILPDLQASLLCEDARQDTTGAFILFGVLGVIRVPKVPITALKLCVFNRWTAGIGTFSESVRLMAPDQITVVCKSEGRFTLKDPVHHAVNVIMFGQVQFKADGVYHVEVLVDDVMKIRYSIPLVIVPPPQSQSPPPPQPPPPQT